MLKLLTVALASDKLQSNIYTPTVSTVAIQLNYVAKGVIIDISQVEGKGYSVKVLEVPAGQAQPKPVLKAMKNYASGDEYDLCEQIFDKYFGETEQESVANHVAGLLEDKKTMKLNVNKDSQ